MDPSSSTTRARAAVGGLLLLLLAFGLGHWLIRPPTHRTDAVPSTTPGDRTGNSEELIAEDLAAVDLETDSIEALLAYRRGTTAEDRSDYTPQTAELARQAYEQAVELDPSFLRAWTNLARIHAQTIHFGHDRSPERYRLAAETVQRAQALDADAFDVHMAVGYFHYWANKDYTLARLAFRRATEQRPDATQALAALAYVERRLGDFQGGLEGLERAFLLDPRNAILAREIGNTHLFLGNASEAHHYLNRAIDLAPSSTHSYLTKVLVMWYLEEDLRASRRLLDSLPDDGHPLLPWCLYWQAIYEGSPRRALDGLQPLRRQTLRWNVHLLPVALLEAFAYEQLAQPEAAQDAYTRALDTLQDAPPEEAQDPRHLSALGLVLAGLGRQDEAIAAGRRAVDLLPRRGDALFGPPREIDLALIYTRLGDFDAAITEIESILQHPGQLTRHTLGLDPRWRPLSVDPRFAELLAAN